ncbi:hypothetical protein IFE17_04510 [Actinobacillus sp. GY-402]|nr:hypothetical protein IFE17_04510 [Actinobacillus sp. GY-402]
MGKSVLAGSAVAVASASSQAADLSSIVSSADLSSGETAIIGVAGALGGFLVVGLAARYVLSFLKRV